MLPKTTATRKPREEDSKKECKIDDAANKSAAVILVLIKIMRWFQNREVFSCVYYTLKCGHWPQHIY